MLGVILLIELRLVRRCDCFLHNVVPVDALKPGMTLDLFSIVCSTAKTLVRILVEEFCTNVFGIRSQEIVVKLGFGVFDILIQLFSVL